MAYQSEDFSQIDISPEERDKLIGEVVRYVLFKTHQTNGCPIKREELTQLVTKNYRQRMLPAYIINEATSKLSSIFGYEMKELQRIRSSSTKQGRASQLGTDTKSYAILGRLPSEVYEKFVENKETAHLKGFTFMVIAIVHLAGGKMSEDNLWHHLRRVGLSESDEHHPVLGNVRQSLDCLVQQRYLQKEKVSGPEGNSVIYELAERALDESITQGLKEYTTQVQYLCLVHWQESSSICRFRKITST